jgi:hypothetical protein
VCTSTTEAAHMRLWAGGGYFLTRHQRTGDTLLRGSISYSGSRFRPFEISKLELVSRRGIEPTAADALRNRITRE